MERTLKSFVERRLAELGINPFEAARNAGLERGYINDIIQGKKSTIRGSNLSKLASALNVSLRVLVEETSAKPPPDELLKWIDDNPHLMNDSPLESIDRLKKKNPNLFIEESIGVYNLIKLKDGKTIIEPRPSSFLPKDKLSQQVRMDYAVVVYDTNMEPELQPGDKVFLDLSYPPVRGNTCLFIDRSADLEGGYALFGRLVDITSSDWIIHQWAPSHEIRLDRAGWETCHKVVGKLSR